MQNPVTRSRLNLRALLITLVATIPITVVLIHGLTRDPRAIPSPLIGRPARHPLCSGYLMVASSTRRLSGEGSLW